jgi:enoyl-CoA hydratase
MINTTTGEVGSIQLDRPARANAYDRETLFRLLAALAELASSRVVVVESTGDGAFSAGADRDEMKDADPLSALDLRSDAVFDAIARAPFVTVAAVHGPAVGGGFELALACDLRLASPRARFWLPETSLGLIPAAGGCRRLTAMVGASRAKAIILGGREIDAETALAWGIVDRIVEDPRAEARSWAAQIARRDPVAQRLARAVIDAEGEGWLGRVSEAWLYARRSGPAGDGGRNA